ncbi:hypothetical protein BDV39DRAFT_206300 [Aspergillus sergii]|uniref:Uncharacterized protein n=1 Tax=Aspergillus sergii TaxID=1034303 RepID=A0A5N6WYY8_9EURO|nr:hypothetical protein BDV39DRAFT_206300 [Aspergillus sergii]
MAHRLWPHPSATGGYSRCWVRIKVTDLLPSPVTLYHGSNAILKAKEEKRLDKDVPYPGLPHDGDWEAALKGDGVTDVDRKELVGLRAALEKIASKARENNVRIVIDAEQSCIVFDTQNPISIDLGIKFLEKYGMAKLEPGEDILVVSSAAAGSIAYAQL